MILMWRWNNLSKEIKKAIVAFSCIFIIFAAAVLFTEAINAWHIMDTYPDKGSAATPGIVEVYKPSAEAFDFQKSKVTTWLIRLFLSFAVPAFFVFSKLSVGIRDWAQKRAKRWVVIIAIYFVTYSLLEALIYLPLDIYTGFFRMHEYGLSNQTFVQWWIELIKSFIVNSLFGCLVVWVPFLIIKKSPKRWWLYLGLLMTPYLLFMSLIQPIVIDPIFNQYKAVEDKALSSEINNLLDKTNIGKTDIFQVDKSKETTQMNAYMTGVFNTKRIVLWDTTINNLNNEEVLGVVAHEMGHYLMGHIWKSIVIGGLGSIFVLFIVDKLCRWFMRKSQGRMGFHTLCDVAALPLIILMLNLVMFFVTPISNAYSRNMELEADRFELELTKNNFSTATATVKLHQQSYALPEVGLVYMLWNFDHPEFKERVDFANTYMPWEEGKPLKYQKFLKENEEAK